MMNREAFLKLLSTAVAAAASVPLFGHATMKELGEHIKGFKATPGKTRIVIDYCSIKNVGGTTPLEILEIYNKTGLLIYDGSKGNPPGVIDFDPDAKLGGVSVI